MNARSPDLEYPMSTDANNQWLIDEMERRYLDSPRSVSQAWRNFFENRSSTSDSAKPATAEPLPRPEPAPAPPAPAQTTSTTGVAEDPVENAVRLVGPSARIVEAMDRSLAVPTATSVRAIPAKLLEVNRRILNNQLRRSTSGGKVSFTHIIGYAVVRALRELPDMNVAYAEYDDKPHIIRHESINLGLAIDTRRKDGTRTLLVPNIKGGEAMDFEQFWLAYEDVVHRVRTGDITPGDFANTTASLTNPGTLGTIQSVPRLMAGQGLIVGVGAIGYPPEYQGADDKALARMGIGRTITITSTYDHRVVQGAQSGEFLSRIHQLLLGEDGFYADLFSSMRVPYTPAVWAADDNPSLGSPAWAKKQARVQQLINMYRVRGHLIADLDPLRQDAPLLPAELDPLTYGLTIWDLEREFGTDFVDDAVMPLGAVLGRLRDAYCRTIGIEYMHIQEPDQKRWIQARVEAPRVEPTKEERLRLLRKLNEAEAFENFLHTKYVGQKRFGLEGVEATIPLLDQLMLRAADRSMDEVVMGMAHRGRLNVLANIVGKSYERIFSEFIGGVDPDLAQGSGDVKYHLGASGTFEADGTEVLVSVVANPSHLEAVGPVLQGVARAKQEQLGKLGYTKILPVLLHGDAAFAGQGVVVETLNLSQLLGYRTGGTIHVIVNNQVGFTTSTIDARSSYYATDVAKTVQAPIFHVNADDPEAVAFVAQLAFDFREEFKTDIVVDVIGYRRRGHNEGDEPSYTQPLMYKLIDERRTVRSLYLERLVNSDLISVEEGERLIHEYRELLQNAFEGTKHLAQSEALVQPCAPESCDVTTGVDVAQLDSISRYVASPPEGFTIHPKLEKLVAARRTMFSEGSVDWPLAEALAFGALAEEGIGVRFAGEDVRRGTFSQRHAHLTDYETGADWSPLQERTFDTTRVRFVDSHLSEFAAVGFEYGYSVEVEDRSLVLWEAQFGDFSNGAQVIFDQFVAAGEDKWGQTSRLAILLPHGFEGQGPEHSSGRIERFLQLCAEDNWRVAMISTAGQYFHVLRRQVLAPAAKPLVLFTPKSLLRLSNSFSPVSTLTSGQFQSVLTDPLEPDPERVERIALCSGKVYYDLARERENLAEQKVALVRVEQYYPFPAEEIEAAVATYPGARAVWVQEEPANMGARGFLRNRLARTLGYEAESIARSESASPATGNAKRHQAEQQELVARVLKF